MDNILIEPYAGGCYVDEKVIWAILQGGVSLRQALLSHLAVYHAAKEELSCSQTRGCSSCEERLIFSFPYDFDNGIQVEIKTRLANRLTVVSLTEDSSLPRPADSAPIRIEKVYITPGVIGKLLECPDDFLPTLLSRHANKQMWFGAGIQSFALAQEGNNYISAHVTEGDSQPIMIATVPSRCFTMILLRDEQKHLEQLMQRVIGEQ